jgi:hypothetical protein
MHFGCDPRQNRIKWVSRILDKSHEFSPTKYYERMALKSRSYSKPKFINFNILASMRHCMSKNARKRQNKGSHGNFGTILIPCYSSPRYIFV